MLIIDYQKKFHSKIIQACVLALKSGKVIAYPTDTVYGLAVDASNTEAVKRLYQIKGRSFNKPIHIILPSLGYAKTLVDWDKTASRLAKKFWPGPLTIVAKLKSNSKSLKLLAAKTNSLGLRMPDNAIALDLAKVLKRPVTTTSANISGSGDCYTADEIRRQFKDKRLKPDIIINAGRLPKRQPSTVIKIVAGKVEMLRHGPISGMKIIKAAK